ncbi:MAG: hypothetical protein WAL75_03925 [Terracidiphilus sp.]
MRAMLARPPIRRKGQQPHSTTHLSSSGKAFVAEEQRQLDSSLRRSELNIMRGLFYGTVRSYSENLHQQQIAGLQQETLEE